MLKHLFLLVCLSAGNLFAQSESGSVAAAKKTPDSPERLEAVRLQIALDRAFFRPGKIDGMGGEFTKKAAERYTRAKGVDPAAEASGVTAPYREYTLTAEDLRWVGPQASTPEGQSKLKALLYASAWEFVAERFHCDIDFLYELNPQLKEAGVKAGSVFRVPNVEEFRMEDVVALKKKREEPVEKSEAPPMDPFEPVMNIRLLRADRLIEVYKDGTLIASLPCTPGSPETPVPAGELKIKTHVLLPDFRWDKSVLETGVPSKEFFILNPGPNNPVGIVWLGLDRPSVGMHGTDSPDQIGRNQSHGCIRTANWDAFMLSQLVRKGTPVHVE